MPQNTLVGLNAAGHHNAEARTITGHAPYEGQFRQQFGPSGSHTTDIIAPPVAMDQVQTVASSQLMAPPAALPQLAGR